MEYLPDTNIIIHLLDASLTRHGMEQMKEIVNQEIMLSVITKMETLGYNFDSKEEQILFETFISQSSILTLNNDIVEETI